MSKKQQSKKGKQIQTSTDVPTEFVCILDRSGSMSNIRDDAIGGFNTFLSEQQGLQGAAFLTMVLFDHEYIVAHDGTPIADVKPLDRSTYVPRGRTALYDAIGRAIATVRERYEKPGADPARVMVVILTDGNENDSKEYTRTQILNTIEKCTKDFKWAFLYLSASPTAFADGISIGLGSANTICFGHHRAGGQSVGRAYGMAATAYRSTGTVADAAVYAAAADPTGQNLTVDHNVHVSPQKKKQAP
jgi:uncharacterized protein YegL